MNLSFFNKLLLLCFSGLVLLSCRNNGNKNDIALARVGDNTLYFSETMLDIPKNATEADSIRLLTYYVNNWVRETVLLEKSKLNLTKQDMAKYQRQIEAYKKSLLIYAYQEKILNQLLDTNVSKQEIKGYYQNNKENFKLINSIIKASYIVLPSESNKLNKIARLFKSKNEHTHKNLQKLVRRHALLYSFNDSTWMYIEDFEKLIPLKYVSEELFLRNKKFVTLEDSNHIYLVKIKDYKIKEAQSPLEMAKSIIKAVIINKRKQQLLQNMERDLLEKARNSNEIKIFVSN